MPAVDKGRGSKSVEVQRVWEIYDERLQFMSRQDVSLLHESLGTDDVSRAWLVWSRTAEAALADAFRFFGGPIPSRSLVLGRGGASFRVVRLGGHKVRKVRDNASDIPCRRLAGPQWCQCWRLCFVFCVFCVVSPRW